MSGTSGSYNPPAASGADLSNVGLWSATAISPTPGSPHHLGPTQNVWEETNIEIDLPTAGTYFITAPVFGFCETNAAGDNVIYARLKNKATGAILPDSNIEPLQQYNKVGGMGGIMSATIACFYSVTGPATVVLEAKWFHGSGANPVFVYIAFTASAETHINAIRLFPITHPDDT